MAKTQVSVGLMLMTGSAEGDRDPEGLDVKIRKYYDFFRQIDRAHYDPETGKYTATGLSTDTANMLKRFKTTRGLPSSQVSVSLKNGEAVITQAAVDYLKNNYLVKNG